MIFFFASFSPLCDSSVFHSLCSYVSEAKWIEMEGELFCYSLFATSTILIICHVWHSNKIQSSLVARCSMFVCMCVCVYLLSNSLCMHADTCTHCLEVDVANNKNSNRISKCAATCLDGLFSLPRNVHKGIGEIAAARILHYRFVANICKYCSKKKKEGRVLGMKQTYP